MSKDETGGDPALDDELPSMLSSVVRGAQGDEHVGIMVAAFGARDDVVEIQKNRVAAAGHDAASAVAAKDFATHGRWDVLVGATRASRAGTVFTHVGGMRSDGAHVLRVAPRHADDPSVDFDLLAPSLLPAAVALAADGDRNL